MLVIQIEEGHFDITVYSSSNSENVFFPGDFNGWNLNATNINLGPNSRASFDVGNVINSKILSMGDNKNTLELKLVTSASWDNQWNFKNWSLSNNITLADNNRQINIACNPGDNITLVVDIKSMTMTAIKK